MASDNVQTLTDANFDTATRDGVVLVDFWAEWCGPCKRIAPIVDELATEYHGRVVFGKLNVDDNPAVTGKFQIRGIPTLLVLKNGQVAEQIVGVQSKDALARVLDKHLQ